MKKTVAAVLPTADAEKLEEIAKSRELSVSELLRRLLSLAIREELYKRV